MPEQINRIPPSSMEAEQSVLGAMLLSENCVLAAAEKLKESPVKVPAKGGAGGRLFGAVTSKEIAEELNRQYGLSVPKQKIVLEETIKTFGVHRVKAKLYQDIAGEILVQVVEA